MIGDYNNRFRKNAPGLGWFLGLQRLFEAFQGSRYGGHPKRLEWNQDDEEALQEWIQQYRAKRQRR